MTVQEAIKKLSCYASVNGCGWCTQKEYEAAKRTAISALEKQIPKKPLNVITDDNEYICTICSHCQKVAVEINDVYCKHCGQKLKWW